MATAKIVLIGPESTGKSTLTKQLADHFNAPYVEEVARAYLEERSDPSYELRDLERIARLQANAIQEAVDLSPAVLFCDTDLVTLHIWSLDKFDTTIPYVEQQLTEQPADLYLLCKPDVPWESDPLREDATRRDELYIWNRWVVREMNAAYVEIEGLQNQRIEQAIKAVKDFIKNP